MLNLINSTQHDQTPSLLTWREIGVDFNNPQFTPWGPISPTSSLKMVTKNAWKDIQAQWQNERQNGILPQGLLLGGYAPVCIPIASWCLAQALAPAVVVAVQAPAPMIDGQRRPPILAGWRCLPPQGVILQKQGTGIGEQTLPEKKPIHSVRRLIHVSARPLADDRKKLIEMHTSLQVVGPCLPALPPQPGVDLESYEQQVAAYIDAAIEHQAALLLDGPPVETAVRVGLLARSYNVKVCYVRTGLPVAGSLPPITGVEELNWF